MTLCAPTPSLLFCVTNYSIFYSLLLNLLCAFVWRDLSCSSPLDLTESILSVLSSRLRVEKALLSCSRVDMTEDLDSYFCTSFCFLISVSCIYSCSILRVRMLVLSELLFMISNLFAHCCFNRISLAFYSSSIIFSCALLLAACSSCLFCISSSILFFSSIRYCLTLCLC